MKKYLQISLVFFTTFFAINVLFGQTVQKTSFYSQALERNNSVNIYLPPNYSVDVDVFYPVIYFLHGWGGSQNSAETIMDLADSLIINNIIEPLIIVCATNSTIPFLGSFYVNSDLNGDYEDYMTVDLISWIDVNYRTVADKNHRTLMGQSMGGFACFRYGAIHKTLYRGFAAHGSAINFDLAINDISLEIKNENNPGPPYNYDFDNGLFSQLIFAMSGAFSPNANTPQTYINPQIVEFPMDEQGNLIDTVYQKFTAFDPVSYVDILSPSDSVSILFGAGRNDNLHLFPSNYAFRDTLDNYGLDYEYFDHTGTHGMPDAFKERGLIFLDSIMSPPQQVTPTSEVGHWEMNEGAGSTTSDNSGRGNHGTLINGPTWTTGVSGNAIEFDGADDKVDCGTALSLDMGTGDFSITGWIKPNATQATYPTLISKGAGASYDKGYWLMYRGNRLWLYVSDGTTRKNTYSDIISLSPDVWYHVAVVIDRDDVVTYYVNGIERGTFDISSYDGLDISSAKSMTMGIWQSNPATAFKGSLDRIIMFNETLTENQVVALMNGEEEGNNPPIIINPASANPAIVTFPNASSLAVLASDPDSDILNFSWVQLSGNGVTTFSTNNSADADSTSATFSAVGDYTLRVYISDGIDSVFSDIDVSVIPEGQTAAPKAHWPMDEGLGTNAADVIGDNDGSLINGTSWITGILETGLSFDGIDDRVDCGNNTTLDIGTDDFSVLTWLKMGSTQNTYPTIIGKGGGASYDKGYWIMLRNNRIWFYVSNGTSRLQAFSNILSLNTDTWYHLAISFDRDELVRYYIDGTLSGTFDLSAFDGENITSAKSLSIGSWGTSGFSFLNGAMDDTRLYNEALTETEINEVITGGPDPDPDPNQVPEILSAASASPDTILVTETSSLSISASDPDGDVLTYSWIKLSGIGSVTFSPNNSNSSNNTQASFTTEGDYLLRVFVSDGIDSVNSDVSVTVKAIPPGETTPFAHWPMDEGSGTTTEDIIGTNDGTLINGPVWVSGILNYAIDFDGSNDRVDCGNSSTLDMGDGDFTVSAWVKMGSSQKSDPTIVAKGAATKSDKGYWFIARTYELRLYLSDGSTRLELASNTISIDDNNWHHIAYVVDRDNLLTFYIDGVEVGTSDISAFDGVDISSTKSLTIGSNGTKGNTFFNGVIDDLRLYDVILSSTEIQDLHDLYADNKSSLVNIKKSSELYVFPNPASTHLTIDFDLAESQKVNIRLFNLKGKLVSNIFEGHLAAGNHSIDCDKYHLNGIPAGMYILQFVSDQNKFTRPVVFK